MISKRKEFAFNPNYVPVVSKKQKTEKTTTQKKPVETFSFSDIGDAFSFANTTLGSIGDQFVNTVSNVYDPVSGTLSGTFDKVYSAASDVVATTTYLAGFAANQFGSALNDQVFSALVQTAQNAGNVVQDYSNGIVVYANGTVIDWNLGKISTDGFEAVRYLADKGLEIPNLLSQFIIIPDEINAMNWAKQVLPAFNFTISNLDVLAISKQLGDSVISSGIAYANQSMGIIVYATGHVVDFSIGAVGSGIDAALYLEQKGIALTTKLAEIVREDIKVWSGSLFEFAKNYSATLSEAFKKLYKEVGGQVVKIYELEGIAVFASEWVVDLANQAASYGKEAGLYLWKKGLEVPFFLLKYIPFIPAPALCGKCKRCPKCAPPVIPVPIDYNSVQ